MNLDQRAPAPWREGLVHYDEGGPNATLQPMRGNPRGNLYQDIVAKYRTARATPRTDVAEGLIVYEDPAPDWLWKLAQDVLEHTRFLRDHGAELLAKAILWCEAGDPVARSARLRDPEPIAPSRGLLTDAAYIRTMSEFLEAAWKEPGYLAKR